jgi:hypothetical protein
MNLIGIKSFTMQQDANSNNSFIISYLNLRIGLGFVGLMLPIVLMIGAFLFNNCSQIQPSISHYYYTVMGNYFVGSLCAVALFLFFYKGYSRLDNIVAKIAAHAALAVAFFPTDPDIASYCEFVTNKRFISVNYIHYAGAAILFSCFAFFSLVLFTKTDPTKVMTQQKKARNSIYVTCGIIISACIILLAIYNSIDSLEFILGKYKPTLVLESIALFAFGISWIAKGEMFLKDKQLF